MYYLRTTLKNGHAITFQRKRLSDVAKIVDCWTAWKFAIDEVSAGWGKRPAPFLYLWNDEEKTEPLVAVLFEEIAAMEVLK